MVIFLLTNINERFLNLPDLHSTMVIFLYTIKIRTIFHFFIYIPLWLYSYNESLLKYGLQYKFTFHYGYILISSSHHYHHQTNEIYIPLWLYSYWERAAYYFDPSLFTFHYGYILMIRKKCCLH